MLASAVQYQKQTADWLVFPPPKSVSMKDQNQLAKDWKEIFAFALKTPPSTELERYRLMNLRNFMDDDSSLSCLPYRFV